MTTLRQHLANAHRQRTLLMRTGRSRRTDHHAVEIAMMHVGNFLRSYPYASDERTRQWCLDNAEHVRKVLPANQRKVAAELFNLTTTAR